MVRFFLGFGFGVVLTAYSFAFIGMGHGTYAPMVFTASLIALITSWGAIPAMVLGPLLWAAYFQFIPRMQPKRARLIVSVALLSTHLLAGTWLALEDSAFKRALNEELTGLVIFALLLASTMTCLFYFVSRGVDS